MSYAIIRNAKYKRENLKGIFRHNERRNKNYSNTNIDKEKSYLNYALKKPQYSYEKEFDRIRKKYNLKGQIKTVSNIACEYIITSDHDFFEIIGEYETKRFFETAYQFVAEYKNLGEQYILSAQVHMDEATPHMHLIFLPVVHTTDKKGNEIDKLACSEFWREKDSYRRLQDAFYEYMASHNFDLQRGLPKEETNRKHYSVEEYKKLTNFENTKKVLNDIKLELPDVPDIADIGKFTLKRDEKILEEIIKPKDELIKELYKDNLSLHKELSKQAKVIDEAEKYQKERDVIIADNKVLNNKVKSMENDYNDRRNKLEKEFEDKEFYLKYDYQNTINKLKNENSHLHKVVDKFKSTINVFVKWICRKFELPAEDEIIRDFEKENHILLDAEKQIHKEEKEKEWDLEL